MRPLIIALLGLGTEDWVSAPWVVQVVADAGHPRARWGEVGAGLITAVVLRGLMTVGDVREDGFTPWPGPNDEVLTRALDAWSSANLAEVRPGDLFWLANTPAVDDTWRAAPPAAR